MSSNLNDLLNSPPPPEKGEKSNQNPRMFGVWALDDPTTPMEFARTLYEKHFGVSGEEIIKTIHEAGKARLGVYTLDIAETKVIQSIIRSRKAGYDMDFIIEPEPEQNENTENLPEAA